MLTNMVKIWYILIKKEDENNIKISKDTRKFASIRIGLQKL